ncbi:uncharacterized protein LOC119837591 [Zerene cesonia]|uniref:uncharacterized protein LOC119837591 n=1 Tax=Zerene cesonia TaxID=33412 RepID=UPI0018E5A08F|nr:uncharacterized protein LOC119837591 [Zerene cesonia]
MLEAVPFGGLDLGVRAAHAIRNRLLGLGGRGESGIQDVAGNLSPDGIQDDLANLDEDGNPIVEGARIGAGLLNEGARDIGLGDLGLGGDSESRRYSHGRNQAAQNYNRGASGAEGQYARNAGAKEFHNIGQRHNKAVTVTKSENDESHNVGGSEAHNIGARAGRRFRNHADGAAERANDYAQGDEQSSALGS